MPTLPPEIDYYIAALSHESRELRAVIERLTEATRQRHNRLCELEFALKTAEKLKAAMLSIGHVADHVAPDELVGNLPSVTEAL